jgi:hypothetical protein
MRIPQIFICQYKILKLKKYYFLFTLLMYSSFKIDIRISNEASYIFSIKTFKELTMNIIVLYPLISFSFHHSPFIIFILFYFSYFYYYNILIIT